MRRQMLAAARLQREIFRAGFTRLAEAALAEELSFRRRALAFHLWQARAEDQRDHPHDEQFPENLADRIHHITVAGGPKVLTSLMPTSQTGFTQTAVLSRGPQTTFDINCDFVGP